MPLPEPLVGSYGTVAGVAALARTWTVDDTFVDRTVYEEGSNPQLTTVVNLIDQVSSMLDLALGKYGFVTPLVSVAGRLSARSIVEQIVADMVKYVNNQGRFFSQRFVDNGQSVWRAIRSDLDAWVVEFGPALEGAGETQNASDIDSIGYRDSDEQGDPTFPIFQRKQFGNQFTDWTG